MIAIMIKKEQKIFLKKDQNKSKRNKTEDLSLMIIKTVY